MSSWAHILPRWRLPEDVPWDTMPIGSFVATELTPPSGYTLNDDPDKNKQEFFWDGKTDVNLVFEDDAKVKLELLKLDDSEIRWRERCSIF